MNPSYPIILTNIYNSKVRIRNFLQEPQKPNKKRKTPTADNRKILLLNKIEEI